MYKIPKAIGMSNEHIGDENVIWLKDQKMFVVIFEYN